MSEGGTIRRATATYANTAELMTRLRQDVESYLKTVLDDAEVGVVGQIGERTNALKEGRGPATASRPEVPVAYRGAISSDILHFPARVLLVRNSACMGADPDSGFGSARTTC